MNEDQTNLMQKNVNDLTVGDALKLNAGILAAMVVIPVAVVGVATAVDRVRDWNVSRQLRKSEAALEQ